MHYQMDGEWIESEEVIEAYPGGAAALRGPHRVVFPTDLTATEGVDLLTPDSKRLRFRVLGLAWVDADTGTQRWLARTRSCVGVIVPPNQVVWEDAFDEVWADVRYTYTSGALEQDIILREPIRLPDGANPRSGRLQVVTEFPETPAAITVEEIGTSNAVSDDMAGLTDSMIGFGAMQIVGGRAFSVGEETSADPSASVPVSKRWETEGGRALLLESVAYEAVREKLERLGTDEARRASRPDRQEGRSAGVRTDPGDGTMAVAALTPQPGLVLDFIMVYSASNQVFQTDQTYKITTWVTMSGSTVLQPGAVLKFTTLPTAGSLTVSGGSVTTPGTLLPRCVFTHFDDNSIGEPIGSGNPVDKYPVALNLYDPSGSTYPPAVQRLEFRYAATGVKVYWPYSTPSVLNCVWRDCTVGVSAYYSRVGLSDLFMCNVPTLTLDLGGGSSFTYLNPILTDCNSGNAAPVITVQPGNRTATVGGSATFTVTATGYGRTYQWYFNNASIPGATGSSYTRSGIQHVHAGQYQVVVANDVGQVKSASAGLTVTGRPQIVVQPEAQTLPEDSVTTFRVGAIGNGPISYQWYRDSTALVNGGLISGATTFELRLQKCLSTDNLREFWVRVSNGNGATDSTSVKLTVTSGCQNRTYTSTADFTGNGLLINLNTSTAGELRLNTTPKPLPYIWVPCTGRGTVSRIDVNSGEVLGEYRTAPTTVVAPEPSRTAVDGYGNLWVANREDNINARGAITRIGLVIGGVRGNRSGSSPNYTFQADPAGQYLRPPYIYNTCVDRDGDGLIRTSRGLGNAGVRDVLPWSQASNPVNQDGSGYADDEAIVNYTRTDAQGVRTLAVDATENLWLGGFGNLVHQQVSGVTGLVVPGSTIMPPSRSDDPEDYYSCGYGGFVDANGYLWSCSGENGSGLMGEHMVRFDLVNRTSNAVGNGGGYGIAAVPSVQHVWSGRRLGEVFRYNSAGLMLSWVYHGFSESHGLVEDDSGNLWVSHAFNQTTPPAPRGYNCVGHVAGGHWVGNVQLSRSPNIEPGATGLAVDANSRIWVANFTGNSAMRINPATGPLGTYGVRIGSVDMTVLLGDSATPYAFSDMSGFVTLGATRPRGYWTFVHDGGVSGRLWRRLSWTPTSQPGGTSIRIEVRAADVIACLPGTASAPRQFSVIGNGVDFAANQITGRFLEVRVGLSRSVGVGQQPSIQSLTVHCN
ncbi:MAG: immunoglobulin domain-containing protein [Limisphaerales bacterium]